MLSPTVAPPEPQPAPRGSLGLLGAAIVLAIAAVYSRELSGRFVFDDLDSIAANPTIRSFWTAWTPPAGTTVAGRPLLNVSFALNYALSGLRPWSYHALNLGIHAAAALIVFAVVRRTLQTRAAGSQTGERSARLGFATALLWALHPLQTASVAYVVQRAESLMGLFYLLTLYAFIRFAAAGQRRIGWGAAAFLACCAGMATKEVMVSAPVVIFLYDRTFVAGSFREAWRRHRGIHLALAACWLPLGFLISRTDGRAGTVGFGTGVSSGAYFVSQLYAVPHYLRLALWPHPLVADYGRSLPETALGSAAGALLLAAISAGTAVLLKRRPAWGFLGVWFLLILAPSSSVVPVATEIVAEHRMYLPLAAVIALGVLALGSLAISRAGFAAAVGAAALVLGFLTWRRTLVYDSPVSFWTDVVTQVPNNAGAWNNLGVLQLAQGDSAGALADFRTALERAPDFSTAQFNLGKALLTVGQPGEALSHFDAALHYQSSDPALHVARGNALALKKQGGAAQTEYREALRLDPGRLDAWFNLGNALVDDGALQPAAEAYAHAVQLRPDYADARINLANVLAQLGRFRQAAAEYGEALRIEPGASDLHNNLGSLYAEMGKVSQARAEFEKALELKPNYPEARDNLQRLQRLEPSGGKP